MLAFEEQNNSSSLCSLYLFVLNVFVVFVFQKMLMSWNLKECQMSTEQEQDFPRWMKAFVVLLYTRTIKFWNLVLSLLITLTKIIFLPTISIHRSTERWREKRNSSTGKYSLDIQPDSQYSHCGFYKWCCVSEHNLSCSPWNKEQQRQNQCEWAYVQDVPSKL